MSTPNAELAYKVLDHIDAYPKEWDQGVYIGKSECGTVACFAGWTVLLSGAKPVHFMPSRGDRDLTEEVIFDGREAYVSTLAQELLNADRMVNEGYDDEEDLFDQFNDREKLGRLVAEVFGPRPGGES